jgi:hypothetical protein
MRERVQEKEMKEGREGGRVRKREEGGEDQKKRRKEKKEGREGGRKEGRKERNKERKEGRERKKEIKYDLGLGQG